MRLIQTTALGLCLVGCEPARSHSSAINGALCDAAYRTAATATLCGGTAENDAPLDARRTLCELIPANDLRGLRWVVLEVNCQVPGVTPEQGATLLSGGYFPRITPNFFEERTTWVGSESGERGGPTAPTGLQLREAQVRLWNGEVGDSVFDFERRRDRGVRRRALGRIEDYARAREHGRGKPLRPAPCTDCDVEHRLQFIRFSGFPTPRSMAAVELFLSRWTLPAGDERIVFQALPDGQPLTYNFGAVHLDGRCLTFHDVEHCTTLDQIWAISKPLAMSVFPYDRVPRTFADLAPGIARNAVALAGMLPAACSDPDNPEFAAFLEPEGLIDLPRPELCPHSEPNTAPSDDAPR